MRAARNLRSAVKAGAKAAPLRLLCRPVTQNNTVEWVARAFIEWRGPAVLQLLRKRAEAADAIGDAVSAKMWREIATAAERIFRQNSGPVD